MDPVRDRGRRSAEDLGLSRAREVGEHRDRSASVGVGVAFGDERNQPVRSRCACEGSLRPCRDPEPWSPESGAMSANASTTAPCALPGTPLGDSRAGIDACVHCGFCLQVCPTYLALEDENDSPRGRILLMKSAYEGTLSLDDASLRTHIDQCLGCRACEPVCPSGVPYGQLLEATRATLKEYEPMPFVARMILFVFAREWLLRPAMFFSRLLAATPIPTLLSGINGRLGFAMAMLASTGRSIERSSYNPVSRGG